MPLFLYFSLPWSLLIVKLQIFPYTCIAISIILLLVILYHGGNRFYHSMYLNYMLLTTDCGLVFLRRTVASRRANCLFNRLPWMAPCVVDIRVILSRRARSDTRVCSLVYCSWASDYYFDFIKETVCCCLLLCICFVYYVALARKNSNLQLAEVNCKSINQSINCNCIVYIDSRYSDRAVTYSYREVVCSNEALSSIFVATF